VTATQPVVRLTASQVAARLVDADGRPLLSVAAVMTAHRRGDLLGARRLGRVLTWLPSDVDAWLATSHRGAR
jgi:hypothetical protein